MLQEVTVGVASNGGYFLLLYDWMTRLHALMITSRSCKTSEVVIRQAPFPKNQGAEEVAPTKRVGLTAAIKGNPTKAQRSGFGGERRHSRNE